MKTEHSMNGVNTYSRMTAHAYEIDIYVGAGGEDIVSLTWASQDKNTVSFNLSDLERFISEYKAGKEM